MTKICFTGSILKISNKMCQIGYPYPYAVPASKQFLEIHTSRGVVGWEHGVPTPFLEWERVPTPFSHDNVT